jgi:hypothetical protein
LDKVRAILAAHGAQSKLERGLPHDVLVYFLLMMTLYGGVAYEEVLRLTHKGLREVFGEQAMGRLLVGKSAISQARARVGAAPLEDLYREVVRPHGPKDMPGVFWRNLRLMAIDGSTLDMPDEEANATAFGRPGSSRGETAFPQLRFVAMAECGTHTLCCARLGRYSDSEQQLAREVLDAAEARMLLMADRGFCSQALWRRAEATGAKLLWRVRQDVQLPCQTVLPDGSWLSVFRSSKGSNSRVRVIEYVVKGKNEKFRLLTNLFDAKAAPAQELAELYQRRWRVEESFDELKTHLPNRSVTLRSKKPELVRQEFYALLITHATIRRLMTDAAAQSGQAAEDLSFTGTVCMLRRELPDAGAISPCAPESLDRPTAD